MTNEASAALSESAHAMLRRETKARHIAVEEAFAPFDFGRADGLGRFLRAQASALFPLERALDRSGAVRLLADWPARRRSAILLTDLASRGLRVVEERAVGALASPEDCFGAMYVLEGSRLGGRMLARTIAASSGTTPAFFTNTLGSGAWAAFVLRLNEAPLDHAALRLAACRTFQVFEDAAVAEAALSLNPQDVAP